MIVAIFSGPTTIHLVNVPGDMPYRWKLRHCAAHSHQGWWIWHLGSSSSSSLSFFFMLFQSFWCISLLSSCLHLECVKMCMPIFVCVCVCVRVLPQVSFLRGCLFFLLLLHRLSYWASRPGWLPNKSPGSPISSCLVLGS